MSPDAALRAAGQQFLGASVNYSPEFTDPEPNFNLLRRVAESGGGKILDPAHPIVNPFQHDRKKTFQPRDLWEWLLKLAIVLFTQFLAVVRDHRLQLIHHRLQGMIADVQADEFLLPGQPFAPRDFVLDFGEGDALETAAGPEQCELPGLGGAGWPAIVNGCSPP